jgi:transcriptional regulator with XRE-family HTH domain
MSIVRTLPSAVLGQRLRHLREARGWSQEKVGVDIGLDESSARARISRYELGVHEPPIATARMLAKVLNVPLAYLYCEDDQLAMLLLALYQTSPQERKKSIGKLLEELD